jgi:hypothetical protein
LDCEQDFLKEEVFSSATANALGLIDTEISEKLLHKGGKGFLNTPSVIVVLKCKRIERQNGPELLF